MRCRVLWLLVLSKCEHAHLGASDFALYCHAGVRHAHEERELATADTDFRHGDKAGYGHLTAVAAGGSDRAACGARCKGFDDGIKHGGEAALLQPALDVALHLRLAILVAVIVGGVVCFETARRRRGGEGSSVSRAAEIFAGGLSDA